MSGTESRFEWDDQKNEANQDSDTELLGKPLSPQQKTELLGLMDQRDEDIDLSDIPEIREIPPDAVRGKFYKPGAKGHLPIYLTDDLEAHLLAAAKRQGVTLNDLVNNLLGTIVAAVK